MDPSADTRLRTLFRQRRFWDAVLVALIFIGGQQIGQQYISLYQQTAHGDFYQEYFGPAVLVACGRPFRDAGTKVPALTQFLALKSDSFSCDQLPRDLSTRDPDIMQSAHRYLMTVVAWQWRWAGKISWSALAPLFGILFGLTLCAAYGLLRLGSGAAFAVPGVLALAISTHHLKYLPQLRDYAKAPLFLLLVFATVQAAMPPFRKRWSLAWAVIFGVVLGLSLGFRVDLVIAIPPFICAVVFFTPGHIRDHLKVKALSLAFAMLAFVAAGWPIIKALGSEGATSHVAVLGLMTAFDEPLKVTRPVYNLGQKYLDGLAVAVIDSHEMIHGGSYAALLTHEYDPAGRRLLLAVIRHFPADILVRGLSSTLEVLDFPMTAGETPYGLTSPRLLELYDRWAHWLFRLSGLGPWAVVFSLLVVAARDVRAGVGLLLLLLYCCGYPATQFDPRHYFHLEFVTWCALCFVISQAAAVVWRLIRRQPLTPTRKAAFSIGLMSVAVAGVLVVPAPILRAYQQRHVTNLIDSYLEMPRLPLRLSSTATGAKVHEEVLGLWDERSTGAPLSTRYVVAEFSGDRCRAVDIPVRVRYASAASENDFSFTSRVPLSAKGPTLRFVPVYRAEFYRFTGFDLPAGYEECLKSVSRLDDVRSVPLLLDLTLDPEWRSRHLYQRLSRWESDAEPTGPLLRIQPEDLVVPNDSDVDRIVLRQADEVRHGVAANSTAGTWFTPEPARTGSSQQVWLDFPAQPVDAAAVLRVRGIVRKGGLRIGTTVNGHVIDSQAVLSPGPFLIMIGVPESGAYGVRISDESWPTWRRQGWSWLRLAVWWTFRSLLDDDFELQELSWIHLPDPRAHPSTRRS